MFKEIFAAAWILMAIGALFLGLNRRIDPAVMVVFSLVALGLFYGFALWTAIVNTRDPQPQTVKR